MTIPMANGMKREKVNSECDLIKAWSCYWIGGLKYGSWGGEANQRDRQMKRTMTRIDWPAVRTCTLPPIG